MNSNGADALAALGVVGIILVVGLVFLFFILLPIVLFWKILSKAGYAGPLALLMLIPIANFVILFVLAFCKWPIERRLEDLQRQRTGA